MDENSRCRAREHNRVSFRGYLDGTQVEVGRAHRLSLDAGCHFSVRLKSEPVKVYASKPDRSIIMYSRNDPLFLKPALLVLALVAIGPQAIDAQENRSSTVRLLRLDGSLSTDLPVKIDSKANSQEFGFSLLSVRLEADEMGFLTRLRSVLTMANSAQRRVIEMEWQLDIYDEALNSLSQRLLQSDKVNIYPGETAAASAKVGAVLPDRMVVLFQLVRVSFADGPAWSSPEVCSLGKDLRTISCKSKQN